MRIEAYNQVQQMYRTKKVQQAQASEKTVASDKVQISSLGKDIQTAKAAVTAAPDVREDKVAAIKAKLASGTYSVSNEDFAQKLLQKFEEMR